jgi:hypothetical protein
MTKETMRNIRPDTDDSNQVPEELQPNLPPLLSAPSIKG